MGGIYERTYVSTSKDDGGNTYINFYPAKDNTVMQTDDDGKSIDVPISTPVFEDYSSEETAMPELADALSAMISKANMTTLLSNSKAALVRLKENLEAIGPTEVNLYLDASNWTGDATNGYTYTCEVAGITAEHTPIYGLGNTNPTIEEETNFLLIDELRTETDTVILSATEKPTVDLIVTLKAVVLNGTPVAGNLEEIVQRVSDAEDDITTLETTINTINSTLNTSYQKSTISALGTTLGSWSSGSGANLSFNSVAYGNGRFVGMASTGIFTSTDGKTWTAGSGASGTAVTFGNGKFVSVNISNGTGLAYTSTDGVTWSGGTSGVNVTLSDIVYGNSLYVAVGSGGYVYYSTDGRSWTAGTGTSVVLYGVTFRNGRFVAVGGSSAATAYYSLDGKTWTASNTINSTNPFNDVTYGNGKFVAVGFNGYTAYSTDGVTWTAGTGTSNTVTLNSVAYANGRFVAVGTSVNYNSDDGITWRASNSIGTLTDVTYGNGRFVAVGNSGLTTYIEFTRETKKIEDAINELYALLR